MACPVAVIVGGRDVLEIGAHLTFLLQKKIENTPSLNLTSLAKIGLVLTAGVR
jgi:hypothetical protein